MPIEEGRRDADYRGERLFSPRGKRERAGGRGS